MEVIHNISIRKHTSKLLMRPLKTSCIPASADRKPCSAMPIRARCSSAMEEPVKATSISSAHPAAARPGLRGWGGITSEPTTKVLGTRVSGYGVGTGDCSGWADVCPSPSLGTSGTASPWPCAVEVSTSAMMTGTSAPVVLTGVLDRMMLPPAPQELEESWRARASRCPTEVACSKCRH